MPDADMPIDQWGNRADIIMDGDSIIKRMNLGAPYEQYVNATSHYVTQEVKRLMDNNDMKNAWAYLSNYYRIASPIMGKLVDDTVGTDDRIQAMLDSVYKDGIYLYLPPNSPTMGDQMIKDLRNNFPIPIGPVTYRGSSGKQITTKLPILIGSMYIILLEKTGNSWSSVSSAKRQHFGILAKLTNTDKNALPWREQPVRFLGESEVRLFSSAVGGSATADLLDLPNSPAAQKTIARAILTAPKPTAIKKIIDRKVISRGMSRANLFVNHLLECAGVRFTNK